jgi:hypothetical protein
MFQRSLPPQVINQQGLTGGVLLTTTNIGGGLIPGTVAGFGASGASESPHAAGSRLLAALVAAALGCTPTEYLMRYGI